MIGKEPTAEDVEALAAFIDTLELPPNPNRESGRLSESALRGKAVFQSEKAGCSQCHPAPHFTDRMTHDVGLGSPEDFYNEYNAPSLRGVYDRMFYLHDGRARNLEEVLSGPHNPARVNSLGELSADEFRDLLAYLESL
jgi:cytochrome c peroxidase